LDECGELDGAREGLGVWGDADGATV